MTVSNTGSATLSVAQATGPGTGINVTGLTLPLTLAPGKSASFTLSFYSDGERQPDEWRPPWCMCLRFTDRDARILAVAWPTTLLQLSASATAVRFSIAALITSSIHSVTLTSTGNAKVSCSRISATGAGFSVSGLALPVTLSAKQAASFNVVFAPTLVASVSGSVSVISTATNSPLSIPLSGSGTKAAHSVVLNWAASASAVRGCWSVLKLQQAGPLAKLNSTPIPATTYTDTSVQAGQTYYYDVTAVDSDGVESAASNEANRHRSAKRHLAGILTKRGAGCNVTRVLGEIPRQRVFDAADRMFGDRVTANRFYRYRDRLSQSIG